MSERREAPQVNAATRAQIKAANPATSSWVSANAGSGKTRVLTNRVTRLLFDGVDPRKILCLTFTKAAASEMQNRLFKQLGSWAMMSSDQLKTELQDLSGEVIDAEEETFRRARRLFAQALETPGGLKIQTIHAFCDGLLRRFPLEAGVSPDFSVLEERQKRQIWEDILEEMANDPAESGFSELLAHWSGADPASLLPDISSEKEYFLTSVPQSLSRRVPVPDVPTEADRKLLEQLVPSLLQIGGVTDAKNGEKFSRLLANQDQETGVQILEQVFLTLEGTPRTKNIPTKGFCDKSGVDQLVLDDLKNRVIEARASSLENEALQKARALHRFGNQFSRRYEARKAQSGAFDYDDLISRTSFMLSRSSCADWVMYRLDNGIDHMLVDEAQDTSPGQWEVIDLLTREMTAGSGSQPVGRSLFVVGDEKQSIYSFQGADPAAFGQMRDFFTDKMEAAQKPFLVQDLLYSFRSATPILALADQVLLHDRNPELRVQASHIAFDAEKPGRIDIWPFVEKPEKAPDEPWYLPVDQVSANSPARIVAAQVAELVASILADPPILPNGKPATAGDILILVQTRSAVFEALLPALKARDLPIIGADRLTVGDELVVRDVLSLLRFLVTPEDDLSLAEALRSPLLGLSESALFDLAAGRGRRGLWQVMREEGQKEGSAVFDAYAILRDLRDQSEFLRPYEIIERLLLRHKGRENLLARLGQEAEDALDELVSLSMNYERNEAPTLTGFLSWFDAEKVQIKREMDAEAGMIRVMTVHGAKGLEAPIVILPDTGARKNSSGNPTVAGATENEKAVFFREAAAMASPSVQSALDHRNRKREEERLRLLYVAITRAEYWLIVCGGGEKNSEGGDWYSKIEEGLNRLEAKAGEGPDQPFLRLEHGNWAVQRETGRDSRAEKTSAEQGKVDLPDWFEQPAGRAAIPPPFINPSDLGGEKSLSPDQSDEMAGADPRAFGNLVHALLEYLPQCGPDQKPVLIQVLFQDAGPDLGQAACELALQEAEAALLAPECSHLFAAGALVETPFVVSHPEFEPALLQGTMDRVLVSGDEVEIVDYKTNRQVPETPGQVPTAILRQMAAYTLAARQIWPEKQVKLSILWTRNTVLMPVQVEQALAALNKG